MSKSALTTNADKFIREGIKEAVGVRKSFREMNLHMINAGEFFIQARESCGEGNFNALLETYRGEIGRTTVYKFMGYVEWGLEIAAKSVPTNHSQSRPKLLEYLKEMVVQSPKPLVAILRALEDAEGNPLMRPFGEYDAVKYARSKLLGNQLVEFDFGKAITALDVFSELDPEKFIFKLPEGKSQAEAFEELETCFETGLAKIRELKGKVVEV